MNSHVFKQPLRGIVPPLVTPLQAPDRLDPEGLGRLIEHVLAGGVAGLFILGTTGEGPALSSGVQRDMIEATCRQVRGRVPVLVGVTHAAFVEAVDLAKVAADAGADAVVSAGPCYFPAGPRELQRYMLRLTEQMPLPLMLYNMPSLTKVSFDVETVRHLMDVPAIVGLKDSSADMLYLQRVLRWLPQRADWTVLVGPEELTAEGVWQGAHGGVNGGANIAPSRYVQMVQAVQAGDSTAARQHHQQVLRIAHSLYSVSTSKVAVLQGIKCALSWLGICQDVLCEPFTPLEAGDREQIRLRLEELELLPVRAENRTVAPRAPAPSVDSPRT